MHAGHYSIVDMYSIQAVIHVVNIGCGKYGLVEQVHAPSGHQDTMSA